MIPCPECGEVMTLNVTVSHEIEIDADYDEEKIEDSVSYTQAFLKCTNEDCPEELVEYDASDEDEAKVRELLKENGYGKLASRISL